MGFMKPQIEYGPYLRVETDIGTEIVPGDLIRTSFSIDYEAGGIYDVDSPFWRELQRAVHSYLIGNDIREVMPDMGFLARLSAPGYMDCTDWSVHDTEEEAREYLIEMYGDDDGSE